MKTQEKSPEEAECFLIGDRFYLGMWFLTLPRAVCPEGAHGGDLTALTWRGIEPEAGEWWMKYRFRYYFEKTAWGKKDKRSWWQGKSAPRPDEIQEQKTQAVMQEMAVAATLVSSEIHTVEYLPIRGIGAEAYLEAIKRHKPHWLHVCRKALRNE